DALVEGRKLEPLLQICERVIAGYRFDEVLQQGCMAAAKSAPLRGEPTVEAWVAVDLQAVEKLTIEQSGQRAQPLWVERLDALLGGSGDLDGIDEAIRQVELDGIPAGLDPAPAGLVDDAPELAEAPAQLPARIVGDVPQQLAKLASRHGMGGNRQIGDER